MLSDSDIIKQQARCIAHEIRNQISICDVYSEVIRKNLEQMNVKNATIEKALSCIQKSSKLIGNNLIDLKSLNNIEPSVCNINQLILNSIELSKIYIFDKNIEIIHNLTDDAYVSIDEYKFLACMINIIKNGIESIDNKGHIKIKTSINNNILTISISNNGKPIPQSIQKDIFNDGYTTKKDGSGIGLYLCKKYFKEQGIPLILKESTNKNTEFEITMQPLRIY